MELSGEPRHLCCGCWRKGIATLNNSKLVLKKYKKEMKKGSDKISFFFFFSSLL